MGLLEDCVRKLRESKHEYERLLGACVFPVWEALGTHVSYQLRCHRGVQLAGFGKWSFIRDHRHVRPVFLLADSFQKQYGVGWQAPPPSLLSPTPDVILSILGTEIGATRDQTQHTMGAILQHIGTKLSRKKAYGRINVGTIGAFYLDGGSLKFRFDPGFLSEVASFPSKVKAPFNKTLQSSMSAPSLRTTAINAPIDLRMDRAIQDAGQNDLLSPMERRRLCRRHHKCRRLGSLPLVQKSSSSDYSNTVVSVRKERNGFK